MALEFSPEDKTQSGTIGRVMHLTWLQLRGRG